MNPKTINAIRDLALKYEQSDLKIAFELMSIAHSERPKGGFIKKKLLEYQEQIDHVSAEQIQLKKLVEAGEVAIIPIGFRCFTAGSIRDKLGISQANLPFSSGFFSPSSVASLLSNPKVQLNYNDAGMTHRVCRKRGRNIDPKHGYGIKFESSTYDEINSITTDKDIDRLHEYIDSSFAYYTLDLKHKFILAHFNWHKFADVSKSKGITDPNINLQNTNDILNKRIKRMIDICNKAKHVFFIFEENQNYNYIQIDKDFYSLNDFSQLEKVMNDKFALKNSIIDINNVKDAKDIMKIIAHKE